MNIMSWGKRESHRVVRVAPTWVAAGSLIVLCGCISVPRVPPPLQVPAGQKVLLHAYAKGVQIYTCAMDSTNQGIPIWKFKAPEATLFDDFGNVIGSHYAGPTWELDCDGSTVGGEVRARSDSPNQAAIPWLLVQAKSTEGPGLFSRVTYIQRVNTTGGTAPATAPDQAQVGQEIRVHYTAEYYFYCEARSVPSLHALAADSRKARQAADSTVLEGN